LAFQVTAPLISYCHASFCNLRPWFFEYLDELLEVRKNIFDILASTQSCLPEASSHHDSLASAQRAVRNSGKNSVRIIRPISFSKIVPDRGSKTALSIKHILLTRIDLLVSYAVVRSPTMGPFYVVFES